MREVLDKDTIKSENYPHLPVAKRGYALKSNLLEIIILCILYKLKRKTTNAIHVTESIRKYRLPYLCVVTSLAVDVDVSVAHKL